MIALRVFTLLVVAQAVCALNTLTNNRRQISAAGGEVTSQGRSRRSAAAAFGWSYKPRSTRTFSDDQIDAFNQGLHRKRPKFIGKRATNYNENLLLAARCRSTGDCSSFDVIDRTGPEAEARGGSTSAGRLQDGHVPDSTQWTISATSPQLQLLLQQQREMSASSSSAAADGPETKRNPPRKFLGKRSAENDEMHFLSPSDEEVGADDWSEAVMRRGSTSSSTPPRKFVGRRSGRNNLHQQANNDDAAGDVTDDATEEYGDENEAQSVAEINPGTGKRAQRKFLG